MSEQNKTKVGLWALLGKFGSKVLSLLAKALKALKFTKVGWLDFPLPDMQQSIPGSLLWYC